MNPQDLSAPPAAKIPLAGTDSGEQLICEVKRHPIGILAVYAGISLLIVVLAILAFWVAPHVFADSDRGRVFLIATIVFVVAFLISAAILFVAHIVYWGNRWIVTSNSITQVTQTSLFHKQISQLSLGNLEDITAEQNGLLAQMLHFGVISAETAAATDKFTFIYCPNPTYYTQQVLAARERFEMRRRQNSDGQDAPPVVSAPGKSLAESLADIGHTAITPEE